MLDEVLNTFAFEQATPATTWTITHGLGLDSPIIDCWVDVGGNMTKIMPLSVVVTSDSVVTVTFSSAWAGKAHVA